MTKDNDYTKHSVTTDALDTLGQIIGPQEKRDAIHLAVEPVEAGQTLLPGTHVRFNDSGQAVEANLGKGIGIVDPFLVNVIDKGEWFWLVVYPRQITTLRHVWEHPAFPDSRLGTQAASERWLRDWCRDGGYDVPSFDTLVEACRRYLEGGAAEEYLYIGGEDAHGNVPSEMWEHMKNFLGVTSHAPAPQYFSCAC